eukprot:SAG31_NODE_2111_length_6426_cov_4.423295_5_plen_103_part_00
MALIADATGGYTTLSTESSLVSRTSGRAYGITTGDVNQDAFPDVYVVNDIEGANDGNGLYINTGSPGFTAINMGDPVEHSGATAAVASGDLDEDGFLDLFVW